MSDNTKQLYKKSSDGSYPKIFPLAFVQGIKDKRNDKELLSYINEINHFKVDYNENPETTRCQVDNFIRKKGLYITYYNTDTNESVTEYFKGNQSDVTDDSIWGDSDNWELVPNKTYIESHAVIPNRSVTMNKLADDVIQAIGDSGLSADEEDLTDRDSILKFKDREYNIEEASGLGYKILRKNWVGDKNILTQDMINEANTIYEIRYDFDLDGDSVIIPDGCVLRFMGGVISNGTLVGQGTLVNAGAQQGIFVNIIISGTWSNSLALSNWFVNNNAEESIINSILIANSVQIDSEYLLDDEIHIEKPVRLFGGGKLTFSENVGGGSALATTGCLYIKSSNVVVDGLTLESRNSGSALNQGASIIDILGYSNNLLSNIVIKNCYFAGGEYAVNADYCVDSIFKNNNIKNVTYSGIAIHSSERINIDGNTISNINQNGWRNVSYGVAITYHTGAHPVCKNVVCTNNTIIDNQTWEGLDTHGGQNVIFANNICKNCYVGIAAVSNDATKIIENVVIANNYTSASNAALSSGIRASGFYSASVQVAAKNVKICDNVIVGNPVNGIYAGCTENFQISNNQIEALDQGISLSWLHDKTKINDNVVSLNYGDEEAQATRCGIILDKGFGGATFKIVLIDNNLLKCKDSSGVIIVQDFRNYGIDVICKNNKTETTAVDKYYGSLTNVNDIRYFAEIDEDCCILKKTITPGTIGVGSLVKVAELTTNDDNLPSYFRSLFYNIYCNRGIQQMLLSENHNGNALEIYLYNFSGSAITLAESVFTINGKYKR